MTLAARRLFVSAAGGATLRSAALLSFVAAYVDTCGFIGLFGLFTAHVTGNFVLIGAALVNRNFSVLARLLATPVFVLGVVTAVLVLRLMGGAAARRAPVLLSLMAALLALAMLIVAPGGSLQGAPVGDGDAGPPLWAGMTLAFAMGLQNALMRLEWQAFPPTTVMTSNITQASIDLVTVLLAALGHALDARDEILQARARLRRMLPLIGMFVLGAAAGALGFAWAGFWCLSVPIVLTLGLALCLGMAPRPPA